MINRPLEYYIDRYIDGTISAEDWKILKALLDQPEYAQALEQLMDSELNSYEAGRELPAQTVTARVVQAVQSAIEQESASGRPVSAMFYIRRWGWAAAAVILMVGGLYFWSQNAEEKAVARTLAEFPIDIGPGKDGAVLTLADGTRVVLDSLENGTIATQSGTEVILKDGQLAYDPIDRGDATLVYNTISTPRGRQFSVQLPDGTLVWLNAASVLRYPTVFSGTERRVEIRGEAYFEVAKNPRQPFKVLVNDLAEIEVLGTNFNVNAYADEATISTTLLEGSITMQGLPAGSSGTSASPEIRKDVRREAPPSGKVMLRPGQQAQMRNIHLPPANANEGETSQQPKILTIINDVDINKIMAWRRGFFNFEQVGLEEVMRQLARWYDIEVVYEEEIPNIQFGGELSKDVSLAELVKVLEASKVHFRIEKGRKLVVLP